MGKVVPNNIEQALCKAIEEEKRRSGDNHMEVAFRYYDLAKYLASQKRFSEADPIMNQAVFLVALNMFKAGLSELPESALPIIKSYEILLKVLGVDRAQRIERLKAALDLATARLKAQSEG